MDCWIGIALEGGRNVVRLAGRLCDAQVPELRRACEGRSSVVLDLTDLMAADAAGIEAIRSIRRSGAVLVGTHGYIQLKLDTPAAVETAD